MDKLISQKYQVDPKVHGLRNYIPPSVDALDEALRGKAGFIPLGHKAGERTSVFQAFGGPENKDQGRQCMLVCSPSPEI